MMPMKMKHAFMKTRLLLAAMVAVASLTATAHAAAPGITGPNSNLQPDGATRLPDQPDGQAIYSWGYGCKSAPSGYAPAAITNATCGTMQVPGPTLIVKEGETRHRNADNNLPPAAGNTSILFPGFQVATSGGRPAC
jgi:FtsP/CotA-like multicopper oxidase with cupredoxin domain